ncbi:GNAT family N-acetyltransferase [Burkholderiaceae bacterium DAT-1]|nr:GNAT family N-acetyltransferase [Burkholderiaceae bacterium DAT-1]
MNMVRHFNVAQTDMLASHLLACDATFIPPLSQRVDIHAYAAKIVQFAHRFEAWSDDQLVGVVAVYCNDTVNHLAFITSVSVLPDFRGLGIAKILLGDCIAALKKESVRRIELQVAVNNLPAQSLYTKMGFVQATNDGENFVFKLCVEGST